MKKFQVRQGDVFVEALDGEIPANAKPVKADAGRTILAYGEVTGHAHALPGSQAKLFRVVDESSMTSYLTVSKTVALQHEEHAPIEIPPGNYRVNIQREYHPEAIRQVAD